MNKDFYTDKNKKIRKINGKNGIGKKDSKIWSDSSTESRPFKKNVLDKIRVLSDVELNQIFDLAMDEPDAMEDELKKLEKTGYLQDVKKFRKKRKNPTYDTFTSSKVDLNAWWNFLSTVDNKSDEPTGIRIKNATNNLIMDAQRYNWNDETVAEIKNGINQFFERYEDLPVPDDELEREWMKYLETKRMWLRKNDS
jgi:hypothetical protein